MSGSDYHTRNSQPLIQTENLTLQYGQKPPLLMSP
jgi:hypothetical protein